MKRVKVNALIKMLMGWLLIVNIPVLIECNFLYLGEMITALFKGGSFSIYLNGNPPTENNIYSWTVSLSVYIERLWVFGFICYQIPYREIVTKALFFILLILLAKGVVFYSINNDELWPWTDKIFYLFIGLFLLLRGYKWKYELLESDVRDVELLQFTINRPSKIKHLIGSIIKVTPAGAYRAIIYDTKACQDYNYHFPTHSALLKRPYEFSSDDIIKTAIDSHGIPITREQALDFIDMNKEKRYHWLKNNCDNYWTKLCKPSRLFRVQIKRQGI